MPAALRWILYPVLVIAGMALAAAALTGIVVVIVYPQLPSLHALTDYRPKIPMRVYTSGGHLIGIFGAERRDVVQIADVPLIMREAILAAEDAHFYQHGGIDVRGILRAAYTDLLTGGKNEGASTITMQVARNFFLSREKTYTRKVYEALLAFKIEANLSKNQILQLYINQIYLGQRAYGFASAAHVYFGKPLKDLSIAQAAMLAGLPKAPSAYNPVVNFKRSKLRQEYVLDRMRALGWITQAQYVKAKAAPLEVQHSTDHYGVHAAYVAEMAREIAVQRFPKDAYNRGLRVYTTINLADQKAAYESLRRGVIAYDRRHGYRGAEGYVDMKNIHSDQDQALDDALTNYENSDTLLAAIVLSASRRQVRAYLRGGQIVTITGAGLRFAHRMLDNKAPANKRLRRGAVIRVMKVDRHGKTSWAIAQMPKVEAGLVAASPIDGAVKALVGGFDFKRNKFNHVIQAWRQPGSSFKPFIYSAALEKGYTPASVFEDEPIVIPASVTGSKPWEPRNYEGTYAGPMTLREALAKSKNMVSIRLLQAIGPQYAQDYVTRFGFDPNKVPPYLTMALGAGLVTMWQQLTGYSVFANGGYKIKPYIVSKITDSRGHVLAEATPRIAGNPQWRIIDARNAFMINSMLQDVIHYGTGEAAKRLHRDDLAGKTGTTNDYIDAWFCGYQPTLVTIAWVGFDQPKTLGHGETGARAALPIWMGFMRKALADVPQTQMPMPPGLIPVTATDPATGEPILDWVYKEDLPPVPTGPKNQAPLTPNPQNPPPSPQQPPAPVVVAKPTPVQVAPPVAN